MEKEKKGFKVSEVVTLLLITCVISLATGYLLNPASKKINNTKLVKIDTKNDAALNEFIQNYEYILNNYYGKTDKKELLTGALNGMLAALDDPYASFFDEDAADTFNKRLEGKYEGIGIEITNNEDGNIVINKVFADSPADKVGLKEKDVIKSIGDTSFIGKISSDLTSYISSLKKNEFGMVIIRDGNEKTVKLKKSNVVIKSVTGKIINKNDKKVGYIDIDIFAANTASQFSEVLKNIENQNIDSLVIDVRDNTGGHLTAVESIISEFLDSTHVIYQMEKKNNKVKYYSRGKTTKSYNIVLLSNENSASASEVLIAALKEEYGAKSVGKTTYGKGTVQELINLTGDTEYKFTTKKWLTPKGNWINEDGIKPDIEVELSDEYKANPIEENDNQLKEAIEASIK